MFIDFGIAGIILLFILLLCFIKQAGGSGCLGIFLLIFVLLMVKACYDMEVEERQREQKRQEQIELTKATEKRIREEVEREARIEKEIQKIKAARKKRQQQKEEKAEENQ